MFFTALTSRSWTAPQSHVHSRTFSGSSARMVPQDPHSFELGNQWSTTTRLRPYQALLYSGMVRNSVQDAAEIARARLWFLTMVRTVRSLITIVWFSRTSRVVSLCRKSRRRSVIRACTRATFRRAFSRLRDPFALPDSSP
jgi:hypothetical protein